MVFSILIMILGGFNELNMLPEAFNFPLVSNILLWITAVLTIISGGTYLWESRNLIDYSK
jgi:phosphatidylglycerophosphate synthase